MTKGGCDCYGHDERGVQIAPPAWVPASAMTTEGEGNDGWAAPGFHDAGTTEEGEGNDGMVPQPRRPWVPASRE